MDRRAMGGRLGRDAKLAHPDARRASAAGPFCSLHDSASTLNGTKYFKKRYNGTLTCN